MFSPPRCAGGTSTLNVEDRLQREGLPASAPAIPSTDDPQEVEHAGDLDAAGRKVKGLRTAQQVVGASRAWGLLDCGDPLPRCRCEEVFAFGQPAREELLSNSLALSADLNGASSAQREGPAMKRPGDLADDDRGDVACAEGFY